MKLFVILVFLAVHICATPDQDQWAEFKTKFGRTYPNTTEEENRFKIFQSKLREIETHNAKYDKGEVSYFLGVNQFSDSTIVEFKKGLNTEIHVDTQELNATPSDERVDITDNVPDSINWVELGAVLEVKDQGNCASDYAFSATGSIEAQNIIKYNVSLSLSEQQIVDCTRRWGNRWCYGGTLGYTLARLRYTGLAAESDYPYDGVLGDCEEMESAVDIYGYVTMRGNETTLKKTVGTIGPVSVYVQADLWSTYAGGIFDNPLCNGEQLNLAVLVVGYGTENGKDYWLIKNSWGTTWGEKGYIRLARNKSNQCGVSKQSYYPVI